MSHINPWTAHHSVQLLKWKCPAHVALTQAVLIQGLGHRIVTIMAEENVIYRDLVHLVVMIGVMMLQMHPMIIGTIGINHPIEIATITIDNTALTIRIGKITTRMVSSLLGPLIGIAMPMTLRNGNINDIIRVQANLTFRINQIMQETPGIWAPQGLKEIKIDIQISSKATCIQFQYW